MFYVFIALISIGCLSALFFFNDTATTEIYTLSLHDALPIWHQLSSAGVLRRDRDCHRRVVWARSGHAVLPAKTGRSYARSEEHTSELQSHLNLVCRLLLEKKMWTQAPYRSTYADV